MPITAGDVVWNITGDTSELKKAVDESVSQVTSLKDKFMQNSTAIGAGFVGMGTAITGALGFMIASTAEAEKTTAQLEAVLKSTGGAAGLTVGELNTMASSLQNMTTYGDESIRSAQSLLLTFTNIGKEVFPQALETVLDMSTALGQDLKSSSIQLGKALQDPILGVTALRRVGVNFNESQIEMIKTMVESGDVMSAQKFILQELATEFGGSAAAAADTFSGRLQQISNSLGDLSEAMGFALLGGEKPEGGKDFLIVLRDLINSITQFVIENEKMVGSILTVIGVWGLLSIAVGTVVLSLKPFIAAWGMVTGALKLFGFLAAAEVPAAAAAGGASMVTFGATAMGLLKVFGTAGAVTLAVMFTIEVVRRLYDSIMETVDANKQLEQSSKSLSTTADTAGEKLKEMGVNVEALGDSSLNANEKYQVAFDMMEEANRRQREGLSLVDEDARVAFDNIAQNAIRSAEDTFNAWDYVIEFIKGALFAPLGGYWENIGQVMPGVFPGYAAGGMVQSGGFIRVGETGPEIIAVPPQTKVMPNKGGAGVAGGFNVNITISNPTFMDDAMMNRFNVGIGRIIGEQLRTTGAVA